MRITLVQPPSNYEETFLLSPPLGLLSIGAAAENEGAQVTLLDFNLKGLQDQRWQTAEYFYPNAVELIEQQTPDMVGFTSMAIESHVCLELARQLKERNPDIITVFGGPHFGAIATDVLEHYDWCDFAVSGEGETPLQNLIRHIEGNHFAVSMDNIAYRENENIVFNKQTRAGRDLDELPFPAYHLVDMEEYFALNPNKLVCFEHARGCFLKCSFCYSPQHWGHGESAKSHARVVAELKFLKNLGIKELFWIGDNLLNSGKRAVALCNAITDSKLSFNWHCYGTLPQINESVLSALSEAGCQSIFVGVDAVSAENQKNYQKTYYKSWEKLKNSLLNCIRHRIRPTCAFMLSPTDSSLSTELTLGVAAKCALLGCFVRINALTHYNGTKTRESASKGSYSDAYAEVLFDSAELLIHNPMAEQHPGLYPFHQAFAETEAHNRFARYCRLSMQIINGHQLLVVVSAVEHQISLAELTDQVTDVFTNDEINCRRIVSPPVRNKFLYHFYKYLLEKNIPTDILEYDLEMTSKTGHETNKVLKEVTVNGTELPHFVRDHSMFWTAMDLKNYDYSPNNDLHRYAALKSPAGISLFDVTPMGTYSKSGIETTNSLDNLSMSDYALLNEASVLSPAI